MRFSGRLALLLALAACKRETTRETAATDSAVAAPGVPGAAAPASGVSKSNYVGLQYDSLPRDFTLHSGAVIPASNYDLSYVATPVGDEVWLDTLGAPVGKGLRARIVRAELRVPPLAADERLFMASCDVNGKLDPAVVAIVVNQPSVSKFTQIRQAWRVNVPRSRFDLLPVAGITCEDPGQ